MEDAEYKIILANFERKVREVQRLAIYNTLINFKEGQYTVLQTLDKIMVMFTDTTGE